MRVALPTTLLILIALALLAGGVTLAGRQDRMLDGYRKTHAQVLRSRIVSSRLGGYRPAITYQYTAGGQPQTADRFAPLPAPGGRAWAQDMAAAYDVGAKIIAYVDPADPARAYLRPEARFYPHGLMLLGVVVAGLAVGLLRLSGVTGPRPHSARSQRRTWYRLGTGTAPQTTAATAALSALVYLAATGAVTAHALMTLGVGDRLDALWALPVIALGLIPVHRAWRTARASHPFGPPIIEAMQPLVRLDRPLVVKLTLPVRSATDLDEARVALVCVRRMGMTQRKIFTVSQQVQAHRRLKRGDRITGEFTLTVPHKKRRPTTPPRKLSPARPTPSGQTARKRPPRDQSTGASFGHLGKDSGRARETSGGGGASRWHFPRLDWQIEVTTTCASGGTAVTTFPITARLPTAEELAQRPRTAA